MRKETFRNEPLVRLCKAFWSMIDERDNFQAVVVVAGAKHWSRNVEFDANCQSRESIRTRLSVNPISIISA